MSLMLLKTKNLTWQDHTLNIEVMMSPQGHTLLLNKHKTLDTKAVRQSAIYERERQSCLKSYILEERLIKRQRLNLNKKKKEIAEARSKSVLETDRQGTGGGDDAAAGRALSAPAQYKSRSGFEDSSSSSSGSEMFPSSLTKPPLKTATAMALKHRDVNKTVTGSSSFVETETTNRIQSRLGNDDVEVNCGVFITEARKEPLLSSKCNGNIANTNQRALQPVTKETCMPPVALHRRNAIVTFSNNVSQKDDSKQMSGIVSVVIQEKSVEDKVRTFLREQEAFNQSPGSNRGYGQNQMTLKLRAPNPTSSPLVANKYTRLTVETKVLEKSFDKFCQSQSFEDLLKTMKLASKMKAHVRQARNTSLVPTMAVFKSTKTFMTLLKRKQRKEKEQNTNVN